MKIEFDTAALSAKEAAGLVGLIALLVPESLDHLQTEGIRIQGGDVAALVGSAEEWGALADGPTAAQAFAPASAFAGPTLSPPEAGVPAPVPPAAAPSATPPTPPVAGSADLDADGLPWDARIHATTEGGGGSKTKDQRWRKGRNVPADVLASVTAELRATYPVPPAGGAASAAAPAPASPPAPPAPAAAPAPPPPPIPPAAVAPPVTPQATAPTATPAAPASGGDGQTATTPASPSNPNAEFARVMREVTAAQTGGRLTMEDTNTALATVGLTQLRELLTQPALVPAFEATLSAFITPAAA